MKLGSRISTIFLYSFFSFFYPSNTDDKITTAPLINIEKIKPSFEELDEESEKILLNQNLKRKKGKSQFKIITSNFNRSR